MIGVLAMMMSLVLAEPPPPPRAAAMVMDLTGRVQVRPAGAQSEPRPARIGERLRPGDRLVVPADGGATLAILGVGVQERLKPGSEATVGTEGCAPTSAVAERRKQRQAVSRTMSGVRQASGDGPNAVGVARGIGDLGEPLPPAIEPIQDSLTATDRPTFAWPAAKGAKGYRVWLLAEGSGRLVWQAETTAPRLTYPRAEPPLDHGYPYHWKVMDTEGRAVVEGRFGVASDSERRQLEELKPLAAGNDRADLLAAALSYRRLKCHAEAIAVLERLIKLAPGEPFHRHQLAELYRQAGRNLDSDRRKD